MNQSLCEVCHPALTNPPDNSTVMKKLPLFPDLNVGSLGTGILRFAQNGSAFRLIVINAYKAKATLHGLSAMFGTKCM
jgi:hypothetical protein